MIYVFFTKNKSSLKLVTILENDSELLEEVISFKNLPLNRKPFNQKLKLKRLLILYNEIFNIYLYQISSRFLTPSVLNSEDYQDFKKNFQPLKKNLV